MSRPVDTLDPLTLPLTGLRLIEASAGTGKTFTLAALYVRLVLGHGSASASEVAALYPPQILVMTFTEAATSELRDRVRQRLAQAALYFREQETPQAPADEFLCDLRQDFTPEQWPACAHRLDMAAQWMDDAAIFTIHSWSSRMLKTHAFDSASLFQQSRVEDKDALRLAVVQDYWRQWFYALPLEQLGALKAMGYTPDALLKKLEPLWTAADRAPNMEPAEVADPLALIRSWGNWQADCQTLEAAARSVCSQELKELLSDVVAAKFLSGYRKDWPGKLREWAQGESTITMDKKNREATQKILQRFSQTELVNKGWSAATDHAAFAAIEAFYQHLQAEPDVAADLLQHAATHIAAAYRAAKNQLAQFDFSDLLQRLYYALQAPDGRLAAAIRKQYPVALVDEFQDTDPWQFGALSKIYGDPDGPERGLVMIGDPKQAIYSFRGADLDTYLAARHQAEAVYTLAGNFRSTQQLVAAVNHVFLQAKQPFGEVPFEPVEACNDKVAPVQVQGVALPAMTVWHRSFDKVPRKDQFLQQMAELFATQMVALLNARACAPGDMAVLVRNGHEARAVRHALRQRGVRSVYLSERDSVYATREAEDLWRLMRAVANPRATAHVRAALGTRLWGLPFEALEILLHDEEAWDNLIEAFHGWQAIWQRQGFLPMLHRLLHDQSIPARLLGGSNALQHDGERRLTNLLHLGDLLQTASASLQGEVTLIRYLERQMLNPKASDDTAQLRLESDAHLVQVVTIHKSKGLQYPLVFLPFVSAFRKEDADSGRDDGERLAEDIRLLYVAMTRAERALWLGLAPFRGDLDGDKPQVRSAVSQLLQRETPDDLLHNLEAWSDCPDIQIAAAPAADATPYSPVLVAKVWKSALQPGRSLHSRWWTASFSALTRELVHPAISAAGAGVPATDRDERMGDAQIDNAASNDSAVDDAVADTTLVSAFPASGTAAFNGFPAGSSYGTLLHDLLEWQFERGWPVVNVASAVPALAQEWSALLQRKAQRLKLDAAQCTRLDGWLQQIVSTPLRVTADSAQRAPGVQSVAAGESVAAGSDPQATGPGVSAPQPLVLAALNPSTAWAEMAFTLPVHALGAARLDALIGQHVLPGQARSPLQPLQLEGMLIGFMDLVLEHQGRYFVLDYKSNRLPTYTPETLQGAILEHRYDVQYTLYILALHRLLVSRLADYDYDLHVGGAVYLFLRGIDQPGAGVFVDRPPRVLIEALDTAFAQAPQDAEVPL
jgi:exodeoxyribonuclease V beta subunit